MRRKGIRQFQMNPQRSEALQWAKLLQSGNRLRYIDIRAGIEGEPKFFSFA